MKTVAADVRPAKIDGAQRATNVLPFQRPVNPLAFEPGTPAFDRGNPAHIRAWNSMCALGRAEARAQARIEREGR